MTDQTIEGLQREFDRLQGQLDALTESGTAMKGLVETVRNLGARVNLLESHVARLRRG